MTIQDFFFKNKKVLIVEDDISLRSALKEKFEEKHLTVIEAGDAKSVLSLVVTEKPDAMVLDLILPLQDGISLLTELRQGGYASPVIILSNLLGSESLRDDVKNLDALFYNKSATSLDTIVDAVLGQF